MPAGTTVYKKLLVLVNTKVVACLLASDFPSENSRPLTRNIHQHVSSIVFILRHKNTASRQCFCLFNRKTQTEFIHQIIL